MHIITKSINHQPLTTSIQRIYDNADRFLIYQSFKITHDLQDTMLPFNKWLMKSYSEGVTMYTLDECIDYLAKVRKCSKEQVIKTSMEFINEYYLWYLKPTIS